MSTIQSNSPEIERAATQQTYLFVGYVILLLLTLVGTVLLYRAGNRYQEAVKKDADARIVEAKQGASEADAKAAEANLGAAKANEGLGKSNEEIARLTKEAEALRAEAETAKKERAEADKQIEIAKATAAQANQRTAEISLKVEEEARKRAEAQRALLELQERVKPRHLTAEQERRFVEALRTLPNGKIDAVGYVGNSEDGSSLAMQLLGLFKEAGWTVRDTGLNVRLDISFAGMAVFVAPVIDPARPNMTFFRRTPTLLVLEAAFKAAGLNVEFSALPSIQGESVQVVVGSKPQP